MSKNELKIKVIGIILGLTLLPLFASDPDLDYAYAELTSEEIVPIGTDLVAAVYFTEPPDHYAANISNGDTFTQSTVGEHDEDVGTTVSFVYDGDVPGEEGFDDDAYTSGTIFKIEMITPAGNPVSAPDNSGDGRNEFTYDSASPGVLTINLKAKVTPSGVATDIADDCIFSVGSISGSTLAWETAYPSGKPTASGDNLIATVKFTTLPTSNSAFGTKEAKITHNGTDTTECDKKDYEVFYKGTATNHPGGTSTDPNWFHYYKENAGGGSYKYKSSGRSMCISGGGDSSIKIGNEAYNGDRYIETTINSLGRLEVTGVSTITKYYANFLGVLAHERQHANNQINTGPPLDSDSDRLANTFETGTSKTDPNNATSASDGTVLPGFSDREVYAGGPVEEAGVKGANTSQDWANPGTNSK